MKRLFDFNIISHQFFWTFNFIAAISVFIAGCNPSDPALPDVYEACCGTQPVEYHDGDAYLFVPNIFTPNGDNINDFFAPGYNDQVFGFDTYLIMSSIGDTIIWVSAGYDQNNIVNTAWDGIRRDGSEHIGLFKYKFSIFLKSGGLWPVEGYACRVACGPDVHELKNRNGCFYPDQIGTDNHLDINIPNAEGNCFE